MDGVAESLKVGIRGTLGLVILAKQIGFIPSARPVVLELRRPAALPGR